MSIKSIEEICAFLMEQADLRALENDEAGILVEAAHEIADQVRELYEDPSCVGRQP